MGGNRMKYYAVKVGKTKGIFDNWPECNESIKGFSGAEYKSHPMRRAARGSPGHFGKDLQHLHLAERDPGGRQWYGPGRLPPPHQPGVPTGAHGLSRQRYR